MGKNNIGSTGDGVQELKMAPTKDHILGINFVECDDNSHTSTSEETLSLTGDDYLSSQSSHQPASTSSESSTSDSSTSTHSGKHSTSSNRRSDTQRKTSRRKLVDKASSPNRPKGSRHDPVRNLRRPQGMEERMQKRMNERMIKSCSQLTYAEIPDCSSNASFSSRTVSLTDDKEEGHDDETVESKDIIKPLYSERKVPDDVAVRVNEKLNRLKKDRKSLENSFRHLYKGELAQLEHFKPCNQTSMGELREELAMAKKQIARLEINRAYEQFQLRNELSKALQKVKNKGTDPTQADQVTSNPSEGQDSDGIDQLKENLKHAEQRELSLRDDFQAYKYETMTTISKFVETKRLLVESQETNEDLIARNVDLEEQLRRLTAELSVLKATTNTSDVSSSSSVVETQDVFLQAAFERKKRTSEDSSFGQKWLR